MSQPLRIALTSNKGAKRPQAEAVGMFDVETVTLPALVKFAKQKLKLRENSTKIRIFVCRGSPTKPVGFELTAGALSAAELRSCLTDGVLLAVANRGDDFRDGSGRATGGKERENLVRAGECGVGRPPRQASWRGPGRGSGGVVGTPFGSCADHAENRAEGGHNADHYSGFGTGGTWINCCSGVEIVDGAEGGRPVGDNDLEEVIETVLRASSSTEEVDETGTISEGTGVVHPHVYPQPHDVPWSTHGPFPVLDQDNLLQRLRDATREEPYIRAFESTIEQTDVVVFDYCDEAPEFPDPFERGLDAQEKWRRLVLRECRGLVVLASTSSPSTASGGSGADVSPCVLARRFHKFFNVNERPETSLARVRELMQRDGGALCFDKIDGALCSPLLLWMTRRVPAPEIELYLQSLPEIAKNKYTRFAYACLKRGWTPLFEWCPADRVVGVIRHACASLTLLAIRHNRTGEYVDFGAGGSANGRNLGNFFEKMLSHIRGHIPVAGAVLGGPRQDRLDDVRAWTGREGVVLCLRDGTRFKLKSDWYVGMAQAAKEAGKNQEFLGVLLKKIRLRDAPTDRVWQTVLGAEDDAIANIVAVLQEREGASVEDRENEDLNVNANTSSEPACFLEFVRLVRIALQTLAADIADWCLDAFRKSGDCEVVCSVAWEKGALPAELVRAAVRRDEGELLRILRRLMVGLARKGKIEQVEEVLELRWGVWSDVPKTTLEAVAAELKGAKISSAEQHQEGMGEVADAQAGASALSLNPFVSVREDEILPRSFADLDPTPPTPNAPVPIDRHVLDVYLPRKVHNYMGTSESESPDSISGGSRDGIGGRAKGASRGRGGVTSGVKLHIPRSYQPDEGKIKGLWEMYQKDDVWDLRVDLQGWSKEGPTAHEGSREHALLLVQ